MTTPLFFQTVSRKAAKAQRQSKEDPEFPRAQNGKSPRKTVKKSSWGSSASGCRVNLGLFFFALSLRLCGFA
jgi:hypothetical protein